MMSTGKQHEIMQQFEIVVVVGHERPICLNRSHHVNRIFLTRGSGSCWYQDVMTGGCKQPDEG
jgi:hypothetical protein